MRRDASFADARSRVGITKPADLVASGDPVEAPEPWPFTWGRGVFLVASGQGGLLILILRGVRGCFLMSTDITLRIIPSRKLMSTQI
jgi:hypothetical protein